MIYIAFILFLVSLVLILILSHYRPLWNVYAFPSVFIFATIFLVQIPQYLGYAVQDTWVGNTEAALLYSSSNKDWIFLMVQFKNGKEPRLVEIPNTPENQKATQKAMEQAKQGLALIQFGRSGGTKLPDGTGNDNVSSNFIMKDFAQSESMSKGQK